MTEPRVWILADPPGREVSRIRDAGGDGWVREESPFSADEDTWHPDDAPDIKASWSQLLVEWGPLTDATGETP